MTTPRFNWTDEEVTALARIAFENNPGINTKNFHDILRHSYGNLAEAMNLQFPERLKSFSPYHIGRHIRYGKGFASNIRKLAEERDGDVSGSSNREVQGSRVTTDNFSSSTGGPSNTYQVGGQL